MSQEYFSLANVTGANFSFYLAGGLAVGTDLQTNYTKLRIDPTKLTIDVKDQKFTISSGFIEDGNSTSSLNYGAARSCTGALATGNIDLRGTPFALSASATFGTNGTNAKGSALFSENNQVVELTGGGSCGGLFPSSEFVPLVYKQQ